MFRSSLIFIGERGRARPHSRRLLVSVKGGATFVVHTSPRRFERAWRRAMNRRRMIQLEGLTRVALNPRAVVTFESRV